MKTRKRNSILIMGVLSFILLSSTYISLTNAYEPFLDVNYYGYIKDTNNQPIYSAKVELYINGVLKDSDYTSSNGYYLIQYQQSTGTIELKVTKNGYKTTTKTIYSPYNTIKLTGLWALIIDGHNIAAHPEEHRFTRDAYGMHNTLGQIGFTASTIIFVTDATSIDGNSITKDFTTTKAHIEEAFTELGNKVCIGDQVVIYIVGHGLPEKVFPNCDLEFLSGELNTQVNKISCGQIIMFIGNCYSGTLKDNLKASNRAIYTSCTGEDQWGHVEPGFEHSIYNHAVYLGLSGEADTNTDGKVSLSELFTYCDNYINDFLALPNADPDDQDADKEIGTLITESNTFIGNQ